MPNVNLEQLANFARNLLVDYASVAVNEEAGVVELRPLNIVDLEGSGGGRGEATFAP